MNHEFYPSREIQRARSLKDSSIKIITNYKKQRNSYIYRELASIIKKQLNIFFTTKKLKKQMDNQYNNVIYTAVQTPHERVESYREKEKQRQWEKLRTFKIKSEDRTKRLQTKLQQKEKTMKLKIQQNQLKMSKVKQKNAIIQQKYSKKMQQLKKHLQTITPRIINKKKQQTIQTNQKIKNRVQTAKNLLETKQLININNYMKKMKKIQEKNVKKDLYLVNNKKQNCINLKQVKINHKTDQQQEIDNNSNNLLNKKILKLQRNFLIIKNNKQKAQIKKNGQQAATNRQISNEKSKKQEKIITKTPNSLQNKVNRHSKLKARNQNIQIKSLANFIDKNMIIYHHRTNKLEQQKQNHYKVMKKMYNIIEKIKNNHNCQQLNKYQIDLLLLNMNKNDENYKEIYNFLNLPKDKFLEQKEREDDEKIKRNRKNNIKIL